MACGASAVRTACLDAASRTLANNNLGTLNLMFALRDHAPEASVIKLGTMGVYGTPNIDIEEGYLEVTHKGRSHTFLYPKTPGSLYHLTKAQDGDAIEYARRSGLPSTIRPIITNSPERNRKLAGRSQSNENVRSVQWRMLLTLKASMPFGAF